MALDAGGGRPNSASDELRAFMHAIGQQESGGRYHILGPQTKYGRPRGKYQILDSNWDSWSRAAGIPGADWRNPAAQERVAAHIMGQYYQAYGSWEAVAVAWFAGPGRAKQYMQNPASVINMQDVLGTDVGKYVQMAISGMTRALGRPPNAQQFSGRSGLMGPMDLEAPEPQSMEERASSTMAAFQGMFSRDPVTDNIRTGGELDTPDIKDMRLSTNMDEDQRMASVKATSGADIQTAEPFEPAPGADSGADLTPEQKRALKG